MFRLRVFPVVFYHKFVQDFPIRQAFGRPMYELTNCCTKSIF